jgi:hypothetical protein
MDKQFINFKQAVELKKLNFNEWTIMFYLISSIEATLLNKVGIEKYLEIVDEKK